MLQLCRSLQAPKSNDPSILTTHIYITPDALPRIVVSHSAVITVQCMYVQCGMTLETWK